MNLPTLLEDLETQKPQKWDEKVSATDLEMVMAEGQPRIALRGKETPFQVARPCHDQIADRLEIPPKYYHRMAEKDPVLLAHNVNTWLGKNGKNFFVRGLGGTVRALLSDRYRVIDHLDVLYCALNELQAHGAEVEDCFLSETEMNIKVKSERLQDFVRHQGDRIVGGLLLTNSETGHKALRLEPRIFRVLCSNGMVIEDLVARQVHLGNGDEGFDETVYLTIRRSVTELFGRFGEMVTVLREATEIKIRSPQRVITNLVEHYRLSDSQRDNILMAFGAEPEGDKYGIANAVTRAAQAEEGWEKCLEMERVGGRLLTLPAGEFKQMDE